MRTLQVALVLALMILGACIGDSTGAVPVCSAGAAVPARMAVGAYVAIDPGVVSGGLTFAGHP